MAINIDYTGQLAKGALEQMNKTREQSFQQQGIDTQNRYADISEKTFDFNKAQKEKEAFQGQFKSALDRATSILNSTTDPLRRQAVMQYIEQIRPIYTGALAQEMGLAETNSKMIDFALQNPTVQEQGAAAGTLKGTEQQANYQTLADAGQPVPNAQQGAGIYVAPQSSSSRGIDPATGERKLSAAEQKEVFDAADMMQAGQAGLDALTQAATLLKGGATGDQPKPYSGIGAGARTVAARVPVLGDIVAEPERGTATTDYTNLVKGQAIDNLKATFGAMPTEGERKVLMDLQAIESYSAPEQERIIANAAQKLQDRIAFNQRKIDAITRGDYQGMGAIYNDGSGATSPSITAPAALDLGGWKVEELK